MQVYSLHKGGGKGGDSGITQGQGRGTHHTLQVQIHKSQDYESYKSKEPESKEPERKEPAAESR